MTAVYIWYVRIFCLIPFVHGLHSRSQGVRLPGLTMAQHLRLTVTLTFALMPDSNGVAPIRHSYRI